MSYTQLHAGIPELLAPNPFYSLYPAAYGLYLYMCIVYICSVSVQCVYSESLWCTVVLQCSSIVAQAVGIWGKKL
jgi:hypothetical protein